MLVPIRLENTIKSAAEWKFLTYTPIVKHITQAITRPIFSSPLAIKDNESDLSESCVLLSYQIIALYCAKSLLKLRLGPATIAAGILIILARVLNELKNKRRLSEIIKQLQQNNQDLYKHILNFRNTHKTAVQNLKEQVSALKQSNIETAKTAASFKKLVDDHKISTQKIEDLVAQEQSLVTKQITLVQNYQNLKKQFDLVKNKFEKERELLSKERIGLSEERKKLEAVRNSLRDHTNRLGEHVSKLKPQKTLA